jgi:hypothetical protein
MLLKNTDTGTQQTLPADNSNPSTCTTRWNPEHLNKAGFSPYFISNLVFSSLSRKKLLYFLRRRMFNLIVELIAGYK